MHSQSDQSNLPEPANLSKRERVIVNLIVGAICIVGAFAIGLLIAGMYEALL